MLEFYKHFLKKFLLIVQVGAKLTKEPKCALVVPARKSRSGPRARLFGSSLQNRNESAFKRQLDSETSANRQLKLQDTEKNA